MWEFGSIVMFLVWMYIIGQESCCSSVANACDSNREFGSLK